VSGGHVAGQGEDGEIYPWLQRRYHKRDGDAMEEHTTEKRSMSEKSPEELQEEAYERAER
jgi:hypothetical protein